ncbi:MAG: radical SAM protein, partial [Candidatus Omnitrophota bacterium]
AFLESKGCDVRLVDAPSYGLGPNEVEGIYLDYKPDFLVIYTGDKSRDSDIEFSDFLLSRYKVPAIFAGPYFSIDGAYFLKKSKSVFCGVMGEFEYPVWEWVQKKETIDIKNLVFKREDDIVSNDLRPYLSQAELDAIPFVSEFFNRHLDFKYYRTPSEPHPFIDIMTGRGCKWGMCTFCLWVHTYVKGPTYNTRSINNVMDELEFIEKKMRPIRSVMIQDDTFTQKRIIEFCQAKIKRGLKIRWSCYLRAEIDHEALKLMKKAGCLNVHVGFESANNQILKDIKKGLNKERMTKFTLDAKRAGLRIHGDFLIGLPGDTEESIRDLIQWACHIRPYTAQFQIFIPFTGTAIYDKLKQDNLLKDGRAAYPNLSSERIEYLSKLAYRRFYFSFPYALEVMKHPVDLLFKKLKTIRRALASVLWKRMDIR